MISIPIIVDDIWEGDETFAVVLKNVEGAQLRHNTSRLEITIIGTYGTKI